MKYLLIIFFLYPLSSNALAQNKNEGIQDLVFNVKLSHDKTSSNFLKNLSRECDDFGYDKIMRKKNLSVLSVLETYPKELALKYFKENYKKLCYYGFSLSVKYLINSFKRKMDKVVINTLSGCLSGDSKIPLCKSKHQEYFYTDMGQVLGQLCTKKSLKLFKKMNCQYQSLKKKRCEFYPQKAYQKCPEYQANIAQVNSLYKQFYKSGCKLRWIPPKCLKN